MALWNGLADCYQKKMIRAVGVSNYGPKELQRMVKKLSKRDVPLASAQIQFSLLSCGKQQMELKQVCDDMGIAVISYSPLALGLLSGNVRIAGAGQVLEKDAPFWRSTFRISFVF